MPRGELFIPSGLLYSKLIAAFVFGVTVVTAYPYEPDHVYIEQGKKLIPQFRVFCLGFVRFDPIVPFPVPCPALDNGVADIFRICCKRYLAWLFQGFKSFDNGGQLHPVICSMCSASGKLLFVSSIAQYGAPSSCTGVSAASSVCKYFNLFQRNSLL